MKKSSIKKFGAALLTTAVLSTNLVPSVVEANNKYELKNSVKAYMNIYDAEADRNTVAKYSTGEYYIYRELENYVNISKSLGQPGAWIVKEDENLESVFTDETKVKNSKVEVNNDEVRLSSPTSIFYTAGDALSSKNSAGTYSEGLYYIYREYNGATNITKTKNSPGAWVVLDNIKKETKSDKNKSVSEKTEVKKETTEVKKDNTHVLNKSFGGYINAFDAKRGVNRRNILYKGKYYIYKEYNGMLNISKSKNTPGSWINPNETKISNNVSTSSNNQPSNNTTKSESTKNYSNASSGSGQQVANEALKYVGYRYSYGSASPSAGFDCSGLTYYTLKTVKGITIPRNSRAQFRSGQYINKSNLQAGDLVFFGSSPSNITHVGIYIGNGQLVHASTPQSGVKVSNMNSRWYTSRYQGARRY